MSWSNLDSVLEQLQSHGLVVDGVEVGRKIRCKTTDDRRLQKSGWYHLHELRLRSGDVVLVGVFGNPREGDGQGYHKVELNLKALSAEEKMAIRARLAEDKRRADAQRKAVADRAARHAEAAWAKCLLEGESQYLKRKRIQAHGLRWGPKTASLVIPIYDAVGRIHALQLIYDDPKIKARKDRDKDFWPPGAVKKGHFFLVGPSPDSSKILLVAEGYATAATLFEATGRPVLVAFDAGNLLPAAQAAAKRWRGIKLLFCADDDFKTEGNPGISSASAASLATSGAWLAPTFADRGDRKLTDFNDLAVAESPLVVSSQVEQRLRELGWTGSENSAPYSTSGAEGGSGEGFDFSIPGLRNDYVLIYGTETVLDLRRRSILPLSSLRAAAGKAEVRAWLEHPSRKLALPEQIVFEPAGAPDGSYNLWGGWPTKARSGSCEKLLGLLEFLCQAEENSAALFDWLLCWLALPIQRPGTKMQTAVLMHGPEGAGKNMLFGAVRAIYGRYGGIFSQVELESQFNGWASRRLFMIGNEVVTRAEIYHQQGRLKNMITEPEWQVNEKNLPTRQESNHCNFVFFSNRLDIAKLDPEDRRYCVIWTPAKAEPEIYAAVKAEIAAGGAEALHDHLLNVQLEDFGAHTPPPMTKAKRELIDLSLDSTERFWSEWTAGHLPVPCVVCKTQDLYQAYRTWAAQTGVFKPAPEHVLLGGLKKKPGVLAHRARYHHRQTEIQATCLFPPHQRPPPDSTKTAWITEQISMFASSLGIWRNPSREGGVAYA